MSSRLLLYATWCRSCKAVAPIHILQAHEKRVPFGQLLPVRTRARVVPIDETRRAGNVRTQKYSYPCTPCTYAHSVNCKAEPKSSATKSASSPSPSLTFICRASAALADSCSRSPKTPKESCVRSSHDSLAARTRLPNSEKWGFDTPCVNEGYAHAQYVCMSGVAAGQCEARAPVFYLYRSKLLIIESLNHKQRII